MQCCEAWTRQVADAELRLLQRDTRNTTQGQDSADSLCDHQSEDIQRELLGRHQWEALSCPQTGQATDVSVSRRACK